MKKVVVFGLVVTITLGCVLQVQADKLSQYKKQRSSVNNQLNKITSDKKKVKQQIETKKDEKEYLENVQQKKEKEYAQLKNEENELEQIARQLEEELNAAEEEYDSQRELLKTRLRVMYENSNVSYWQTLIESKSIIDFFERLQLISLVSKNDKRLMEELDVARQDVELKKQKKEEARLAVLEKARSKEKAITDLKVSRADVEQDLKKYEITLEELEKQEDELNKLSKQLNSKIQSLMSKGKYTGGVMKWPCPSSSRITSEYGNRYHPVLKKRKLHTGIDIGAKKGSSIVAAAKGKVIKAGWETGYGNTVVIDHGGNIATLYAHCSKILVSVGDEVETGQTIAKVGSTGWSTGPHLHFEVIKNGSCTNPVPFLKGK
ncbi:MAG: peptidoglycan DD-metalloendopeptidase family protein [Clostridia bacterium]|nr:peptidoglycan DD-metalloendopeptidase family protein [Clostridia bacterium]